jgi:FkbM family methyltransferase
MESFRLWLKKEHLGIYNGIRNAVFPFVNKRRQSAAQNFTKTQAVLLNHNGQTWQIIINPENGFVDRHIFTSGVYEPDILTVINNNLNPGDTFVDIGTNIGQHSLFAASVVGESGKVISFEPIPSLVKQFSDSIKLNNFEKRIVQYPMGCSNTEGSFPLKIKPGNIGGSGFHLNNSDYETINVPTTTADKILSTHSGVDFIKIDTEGHELEALKGLTETLKKHHPKLLIEFSPCFWGENALTKTSEFFKILSENHYSVFDLEDQHKEIIEPVKWFENFSKMQTNFLCLKSK